MCARMFDCVPLSLVLIDLQLKCTDWLTTANSISLHILNTNQQQHNYFIMLSIFMFAGLYT